MNPSVIPPKFVTFTGIDERTDMARVVKLSEKYRVEWGVLHSKSRRGKEPRYPSQPFLDELLREKATGKLPDRHLNLAAHICGSYAREIVQGEGQVPDLKLGMGAYKRAQINYVPREDWFPDLRKTYVGQIGALEVMRWAAENCVQGIIQHRTLKFPKHSDPFLTYLFDKSGGKGESPKSWPKPDQFRKHHITLLNERWVGFAGGIGPHNVEAVVEELDWNGAYWIDMEGQVRTDDWLDLDKCEEVLRRVYGPTTQS